MHFSMRGAITRESDAVGRCADCCIDCAFPCGGYIGIWAKMKCGSVWVRRLDGLTGSQGLDAIGPVYLV